MTSSKVLRLAAKLGIPISPKQTSDYGFLWNGKTICTGQASSAEILHEIAHWQISAPSRRRYSNFVCSSEEECLVSLLGIAWEARFKNRGWHNRFEDHNWTPSREITDSYMRAIDCMFYFWKYAAKLQKLGFLNERGEPQPIANHGRSKKRRNS